MNRPEATLEELLVLLPDLDELEVLRLRLMGAAVPDVGKEWDSYTAYATIDKRVVTLEHVEHAIDESEIALQKYVTSLHAALRPIFRSFWTGSADETARHLIAFGEEQEKTGRLVPARRWYRAALSHTLPLADKGAQILALRRIARVSLAIGDFQEALAYYQRSTDLAVNAGELAGEIIGRTGWGNVLYMQGRWAEAESCYEHALRLADSAAASSLVVERGVLYMNLATTATRQERLEEADSWFERAMQIWEAVPSPTEEAICYLNLAHLRNLQGKRSEASEIYHKALTLPAPSDLRAVIATDLADLYLRDGHLTAAEEWGHDAEEHAIAAQSPYALGRMYQGRGNIARARGDADGFTFYEKALEIARGRSPILEAETLMDYALLRHQTGGSEEAEAYLERAGEILHELGAVHEKARAERLLADIRSEDSSLMSAAGD